VEKHARLVQAMTMDFRPLDVPGYLAGADGRIYSTRTQSGGTDGPLRALSPSKRGRYLRVALWNRGRPVYCSVHALIAAAFHGPRPDGASLVRHLDDDPTNNKPENVAWGTPKDNGADKVRNGRTVRGEAHWSNKLTLRQATRLKRLAVAGVGTVSGIAEHFGVSRKLVRMIRSGRAWGHVEV